MDSSWVGASCRSVYRPKSASSVPVKYSSVWATLPSLELSLTLTEINGGRVMAWKQLTENMAAILSESDLHRKSWTHIVSFTLLWQFFQKFDVCFKTYFIDHLTRVGSFSCFWIISAAAPFTGKLFNLFKLKAFRIVNKSWSEKRDLLLRNYRSNKINLFWTVGKLEKIWYKALNTSIIYPSICLFIQPSTIQLLSQHPSNTNPFY